MTPDFSRYERIVATRNGRILTLTLTAPNPVNAVDGEMHHELSRIFLDAQDDPDSDLVVLTGAGRAFCAGGDTAWFKTHIEDPASFRAIGPEAKRIVTSLLDMEKPILCRLNGAAAGLGATIALMCDVIIASDKAVVGDPHVKVGLVAGDGGAIIWRWPRRSSTRRWPMSCCPTRWRIAAKPLPPLSRSVPPATRATR